jgi:hypothetical protein
VFVNRLWPLVLATTLALPATAQAGHLTLDFTGVVSDGATGRIFPYGDMEPGLTSFAGEPMLISLSVAQGASGDYVDAFTASWSDQTYALPYIRERSGGGLEQTEENESAIAFFSFVTLTDTGGHIRIFPTPEFHAATDADFTLDFAFTYSSPHDPNASFVDNAIAGGGNFDASLNFVFADFGPYDALSSGDFTLSSVTQTVVPEPALWAVMILGFGGAGMALRRRRVRVA